MTDDVTDKLPTSQYWCAGMSGKAYVDLNGDGNDDTVVIFTTINGMAYATDYLVPSPPSIMYKFSIWPCAGDVPPYGTFKIHFVELTPIFDENDPNTWIYKKIPAVSLVITTECDVDYTHAPEPWYHWVHAYRNRDRNDEIANSGRWEFSDSVGIEELHVTTSYITNYMDQLILYDTEQDFGVVEEIPPTGVVLLFDTSGSMSWSHEGARNVDQELQRISLAKRAAIPFLELMNDHFSEKMHFGIAVFPWHPWQINTPCGGQTVTNKTLVDDANIQVAVSQTIPNLIAEGNTPLLAGIENASIIMEDELYQVIVLLSDGYHNCPSWIEGWSSEATRVLLQLSTHSIKLYSIGFARPTDIDYPLLRGFAEGSGGEFYPVTGPDFVLVDWDPATALQAAYKTILIVGLGLQPLADPFGTIKAGETEIKRVKISEYEEKVSFYLSWATPMKESLDLSIKASNNQYILTTEQGVRFHKGKTHLILTVDEEILQKSGKVGPKPWEIVIDAKALTAGEEQKYQFSVIAGSRLKIRPQVTAPSLETGAKITVTAKIMVDNKPVTGLKDVSVRVFRPKESLENWFAKHDVSFKALEKVAEKTGQEKLCRRHRKSIYLLNIEKIKLPGREESDFFQLYDDGTHGDAKTADGIYTNMFSDTDKEGYYSFYFHATGKTPKGNFFEREMIIQKFLKATFSPEHSTVEIVPIKIDKGVQRIQVVVVPKDAYGNYIGLGYSGKITIKTTWGKAIGKLQDNLDGSYTQEFDIPKSVSPDTEIKVKIDDKIQSIKITKGLKAK
ncbi:MAG: choice-of-anchor X domain-containing protein [Promethearchaeota archaeon]